MFRKIKNRHLKIAIVIAPLLAIGGWGLAELFDREHNPQNYDLQGTRSLCAIASKPCEFKQGKLFLRLTSKKLQGEHDVMLRLESLSKLDYALISIASKDQTPDPLKMHSKKGLIWKVPLTIPQPQNDQRNKSQYLILRMVTSLDGRQYLSERPIRFSPPKTQQQ